MGAPIVPSSAKPTFLVSIHLLLGERTGSQGSETVSRDDVVAGIKEAISRGAIGFDAVKHLVLCRIERRPPRLDLTVYPYLPRASLRDFVSGAYT